VAQAPTLTVPTSMEYDLQMRSCDSWRTATPSSCTWSTHPDSPVASQACGPVCSGDLQCTVRKVARQLRGQERPVYRRPSPSSATWSRSRWRSKNSEFVPLRSWKGRSLSLHASHSGRYECLPGPTLISMPSELTAPHSNVAGLRGLSQNHGQIHPVHLARDHPRRPESATQ
jgi:hypothetical protein